MVHVRKAPCPDHFAACKALSKHKPGYYSNREPAAEEEGSAGCGQAHGQGKHNAMLYLGAIDLDAARRTATDPRPAS